MILLTIEEVKSFLADKPEIHAALTSLFETCIAQKKPLFKAEEVEELTGLVEFGLLNQSPGDRFEFNYDSLVVCFIVKEVAERFMKEVMPTDIVAALNYADRFYLDIRQPKPNHTWYFHLALEFDRFVLLYLNQVHQVDVSAFYATITKEMLDETIPLRHYDTSYSSAFPFLDDDIHKAFETIKWMYADTKKKEYGGRAITDLGKYNPTKAKLLYDYAKLNGAEEMPEFLSRLQIELFVTSPKYYFDEAVVLLGQKPVDGLLALAWVPYKEETYIRAAFDLINVAPIIGDEYLMNLPAFYCRLIENLDTPEDIRYGCIAKISELLNIKNDPFRHQMIWRLGMVEGYDELKYQLLSQIINISPKHMQDFFNRFENPAYLFNLLSATYEELGAAVDFNLFSECFTDVQHRHPEIFESELLKLLTDDLAVIRLAGLMVLRSKYSGIYEVDFLKLSEKGQQRILETLLPHPHSIEELLPLLIKLKESQFDSVKTLLKKELFELIWAFDHHLLDLIKPLLEPENEQDNLLMSDLEAAYSEFEQVKKQKAAINEFSPLLNELSEFEYYFQVETEQRTEQMEKATKQSFITQLAKNISVIRGSGFKTEGTDHITKLGTVSTSMLIDMRYYQNPDVYQWEYNQEMTGFNYPKEEVSE